MAIDSARNASTISLFLLTHGACTSPATVASWLFTSDGSGPGHLDAMSNLGVLLDGQGKPDEAEEWWRKAADAGHLGAMSNLGALLAEQGKPEQAEEWWRKAADAEDTDAMSNLGGPARRPGQG